MTEPLAVCLHGQVVGHLSEDDAGRLRFQYTAAWADAGSNPPLSLALPVRAAPYGDAETRPFFANLLPDADVRRHLAQSLGLSEGNDFALLRAIGGDCAGAVSVIPGGGAAVSAGRYEPLSRERLATVLNELPQRPLLASANGEIRLSLAGAQYKLPVFIDVHDMVFLPVGSHASSHILKPPNRDFAELIANEFFCMRLAAATGLPVPTVAVRDVGFPVYQVARYDRAPAAPSPQRLHQEDFCQALGVSPNRKYEAEGGPTLARCFGLLDEVSVQPAADRLALLRWTILNLLIGNADSHAKNLSLLLDGGPRLAPFYDLISTAVIPRLSKRFAMRIGGVDEWIKVKARLWDRFASEVGMTPRLVREEVARMAEVLPALAERLVPETVGTLPSPVYTDIKEEIARRSAAILKGLSTAN
jgi:serine/threonine-protein kinase HipA